MKVLLAIGLVGLAALAGDDTPRYAPQAGAQLVRTWESRVELELSKWEMDLDDQSMDALASGFTMRLEHTRQLELTDLLDKVSDARPERVKRTFAKADAAAKLTLGSNNGGESSRKFEGKSPLVGETVVFERDGDAWKVAGRPAVGEKLLADLEQDLDLAAWLPPRAVAVGARWEVDARAVDALLRPGGALKLALDASGDAIGGAEILGVSPDLLIGPFAGVVRAKLMAVEERGGARLARIELDLDVRAKKDLTEIARDADDAEQEAVGGQTEVREAIDELHWVADGELVWDLSAGRMRSLEVDGDLDVAYRLRVRHGTDVYGREWLHRMTFRGKLAVKLEVGEP